MLFFLLLGDFIHEISAGEFAAFRQCCCYACSACPLGVTCVFWATLDHTTWRSPTDWGYLVAYFDEFWVEFLFPAIVTHCNASNLMLDILKPDIIWWTICIKYTLESFLSKVAFESNLRKKLSRIEHVLIVNSKEEKLQKFSWHTCKFSFKSHFWKRLSKENFLVCH